MAQCPTCQKDVPDDFGLIECPGCGIQLFIEMDGRVIAADSSGRSKVADEHLGFVDMDEQNNKKMSEETMMEKSFYKKLDRDILDSDSPEEAAPLDATLPIQSLEEESPLDFASDPAEETWEDPVSEQGIFSEPNEAAASADLSDLTEFANSDAVKSSDGGLSYSLIISGVDSIEIRTMLKDLLSDQKLLWDHEALLRKIKDGVLRIENIPAVKAAFVVQQMSDMPVHIQWVQNA